jgi:hypothetical protein
MNVHRYVHAGEFRANENRVTYFGRMALGLSGTRSRLSWRRPLRPRAAGLGAAEAVEAAEAALCSSFFLK